MSQKTSDESNAAGNAVAAIYQQAETAIRQLERFEKTLVRRGQGSPRREARGMIAASDGKY